MNSRTPKVVILCLIHLVILSIGIAAALLLPSKVTYNLSISVTFCVIAYLCFAASTVIPYFSTRQQAMQNGGLITASLIYLLVTLIASVVLTLAKASFKVHLVLEIVIMGLGIVLWALMFLTKLHIDEQ